ncbi:hypothetical protein [Epibacterium ulvae]|uniref:hypothetical protein n=1 Tax=Epibacterium ulvae TaxID=1156985 RepID=UPI002490FB08|nr:hypothetical protein [Epibacterium ulvae]
MSSYQEQQQRSRRGVIIAHMLAGGNQPINADMLLIAVKSMGIPSFYQEVVEAIQWLAEKGFVKVDGDSEVVIAQLTKSGVRVARGDTVDAGVTRPDPGV